MEMACTYDISDSGARIVGLLGAKTTGEVVAIERGRSRALCRVVWIGQPNSELRGQVGLECVENTASLGKASCGKWKRYTIPFICNSNLCESDFLSDIAQTTVGATSGSMLQAEFRL